MRGTCVAQVSVCTGISSLLRICVARGTAAYGMWGLTVLSVNRAAEHSKDRSRGALFVDTLAAKLDVRLCMAEPVQVNLWKMAIFTCLYALSAS